MKTFKDLEFKKHEWARVSKQAVIYFKNGYGVSVLLGTAFYSNGKNTYELAVLYNGQLTYSTPITDSVLPHITEEEVTNAMIEVQKLKN
jgi:hypothetical protein